MKFIHIFFTSLDLHAHSSIIDACEQDYLHEQRQFCVVKMVLCMTRDWLMFSGIFYVLLVF